MNKKIKEKEQICKNCSHYIEKEGFTVKVCIRIDDNYTQHYCGYFMPPEDFGCNRFWEKD